MSQMPIMRAFYNFKIIINICIYFDDNDDDNDDDNVGDNDRSDDDKDDNGVDNDISPMQPTKFSKHFTFHQMSQ
ncbi:hypothetical protein RclHR1_15980006 [Rhizophagus clarus]|uniref:Uncharacterized protein n=1 Tax=Rhizophagus clarus TaxID=94130 RepID=A0A2Z6QGI6_9GLOM|nr:hypothetical protein RclHR1_15980006 [Rhizophagus clarus]GES78656.1 hypothetical protein RCL_e3698_RclHR1_15980006 [Rhizophagus clarus]